MPGILLTLLGVLAYYSKSKYFPTNYSNSFRWIPKGLGLILFVLAIGSYVFEWGMLIGSLVAITVIPCVYCLLMLLLNIPKKYAAALSIGLLILLAFELLY